MYKEIQHGCIKKCVEAVGSRSSEWISNTFQLFFTKVKNSMIDIKHLLKSSDVVLINICVIRIISLCLLLCNVTQ